MNDHMRSAFKQHMDETLASRTRIKLTHRHGEKIVFLTAEQLEERERELEERAAKQRLATKLRMERRGRPSDIAGSE